MKPAFVTAALLVALHAQAHAQDRDRYDPPPKYDAYGHALVLTEKGWRYIDRDGKPILQPFIYDNGPDYYQEGLARFVANGKMGFHDKALHIVIPARYDHAFPFQNGKALVGMDCSYSRLDEHTTVSCKHWDEIALPAPVAR